MEKMRSKVKAKDTWNVAALYPSVKEWEKEFKKIDFSKLASYRGRLHEGEKVVKEAFECAFTLGREVEKLHTYAHLRHDEEITVDLHKNAYQRILSTAHDFQEAAAWMEPEILSLPDKTIQMYLSSPLLAPYRFHLEKIVRMAPHTLSADKEELLALAAKPLQTSSKAFGALNNADIKFSPVLDSEGKEHEMSHGLYQLYLRSPDRTLRENAFKEMHGKFKAYENTLAELLYGQVQGHVFSAKAHNFKSSLEAALFPKNIPTTVYHSLIKAVRQHLPKLHRYMKLRKKVLKLDQLHLYDLYVPMVSEVEIELSYDESEKLVIESTAPLGKEYQSTLQKGLETERWVDRYENDNKRSGAYSSGCYDSYPYILMNYRGILRDTFTLAHEAGHSMHTHMSHTHQPYHDSHYPIFVAEVASTFNEELLMDLLLKQRESKEERLFLINEKLDNIRATLFRQTLFAEFELAIHERVEQGLPLTPTYLKETYYQLNLDYFGSDVAVDEDIAIEWARIPHFYYNYYVYQYATGVSAALTLASRVLAGDSESQKNYLSFLQGGGSLFPIDLLKLAGVDMTAPQAIETALQKFDLLITEFEKNLI
ncbi:MAG: Oligoendopeptidase F, plasmid [Chlamydiales bacterium]|nr:Oligoendopeptidase F, plasmid [Chlamydiales bacterium]MCH9620356.1 Oligoendopeptidase F, plasmid [Chlamydiales bacterium]MCH9622342.1 Oligoendopeptidase F, plasmid [Chlamydiales bacterium]